MSIHSLAARLQYDGGNQLSRINKQKLRSLQAALKNDQNSRMIKTPYHAVYPCLINDSNTKSDYDKRYIAVEFDSKLECGDVVEILDSGQHYMIYLQDIVETAYLRAEIIECRYQLDVDGEKYWVYFQGPTETDIRWYIKSNLNYNELNYSGTVYIKNDERTKNYFHRFSKIKLAGHTWEVKIKDSITVPGIIELEVMEWFENSIKELPDIKKEETQNAIIGLTTVKQDSKVGYYISPDLYDSKIEWKISGNPRVEITNIFNDGHGCEVLVHPGAINSYVLSYGENSLEIQIDWIQPIIQGPQIIYPYDIKEYHIEHDSRSGTFFTDSNLVEIKESKLNWCKLEVLTGKKGQFTLSWRTDEDDDSLPNQYNLDIEIDSL